jgi:hypothetical protein
MKGSERGCQLGFPMGRLVPMAVLGHFGMGQDVPGQGHFLVPVSRCPGVPLSQYTSASYNCWYPYGHYNNPIALYYILISVRLWNFKDGGS